MAALAAALSGISTKPKPTGLAGVTIGNDIDLVHRTIRFEELAEVLSRRIERNIAHINVHARVLL